MAIQCKNAPAPANVKLVEVQEGRGTGSGSVDKLKRDCAFCAAHALQYLRGTGTLDRKAVNTALTKDRDSDDRITTEQLEMS